MSKAMIATAVLFAAGAAAVYASVTAGAGSADGHFDWMPQDGQRVNRLLAARSGQPGRRR